ncbi:MAG: flagellar hook-length control protein FliK [Paracoccaceae bacterium]
MTLPEPIQSPRAARGDMIAAMGGAGSAVAAPKGDGAATGDFALSLADAMGAEAAGVDGVIISELAPDGAMPGAESVSGVVLEDLGQLAALLPATAAAMTAAGAEAGPEGTPEAAEAAPPPGAALQAALAGAAAPAAAAEAETDETEDLPQDPLLALVVPQADQPGPVAALPPGEGEKALAAAVSVAVSGGLAQPMMQQQAARPAAPLPGTPLDAPAGEESGGEGTEDAVGEGLAIEATDGPATAAETARRREALGLAPGAVAMAEPAARQAGNERQAVAATEAVSPAAGQAAPMPQQAPAMVGPAQPTPAAAFAAQAPIATDRPGWEGAIADRIAAELSGDGQQIDLDLAPEHMGRLKIRLDMTDGQAQVRFVTETPEAARLLQQNEHRLSESLSRAGLSLGGQETTSRDPQGDPSARGGRAGGLAVERPAEARTSALVGGLSGGAAGTAARGLVNLIA